MGTRRSLENEKERGFWNFAKITAAQVDEWPQYMKGGLGRGNRIDAKTVTVGGDPKSEMTIVLFCRKCQKETPHVHFGQRNDDPPRAIRSGIIVPGLEWDGSKCSDWFKCEECGEKLTHRNPEEGTAAQ